MLDTEVLKLIDKGVAKAVGDLREQLTKANSEIADLRNNLRKAERASKTVAEEFWERFNSPSGGLFERTESGGAPLQKVNQSQSAGLTYSEKRESGGLFDTTETSGSTLRKVSRSGGLFGDEGSD